MLNQVGPSLNIINILKLRDLKFNIKNTQRLKFWIKLKLKI